MKVTYNITTVFGLPGAGKGHYCRERSPKGIGQGEGHWRPEPTEDIKNLRTDFLQEIIVSRFTYLDTCPTPAQYRDSDIWTSYLLFGSMDLSEVTDLTDVPLNIWVPYISDRLVWIKTPPEVQAERIAWRARENWEDELRFCSLEWHEKAQRVYDLHPAKIKTIVQT
jgi:hypothetical protein